MPRRGHAGPEHGPRTICGVESESARQPASRMKRLAREVYDAQAGSRSPILDGPWWLGMSLLAAVAVLLIVGSPWKWLALLVLIGFFWLPFLVRWAVALARTVPAFRKGYGS